ncbi:MULTISPECIES: hypothetical protein [unclassified Nocardioides]|uniref:hypothetical protein n=1 Tax=unclassified Nocardioides TaxID=2615069 RepID=UPI000A8B49E7|nr:MULTISPECIES: hypothetical protein [unclassified Nocardioides]
MTESLAAVNGLLIALVAKDNSIPEDKDVVAGWLGFSVFIALIVAVALLCWSLTRQLRKTRDARDAGVFGDQPKSEDHDTDA